MRRLPRFRPGRHWHMMEASAYPENTEAPRGGTASRKPSGEQANTCSVLGIPSLGSADGAGISRDYPNILTGYLGVPARILNLVRARYLPQGKPGLAAGLVPQFGNFAAKQSHFRHQF